MSVNGTVTALMEAVASEPWKIYKLASRRSIEMVSQWRMGCLPSGHPMDKTRMRRKVKMESKQWNH